jgi:transposase-like protein
VTAKFKVVNLEISHRSAVLASPVISLQDLSAEFAVRHLWRKLRTTNVIERCFVEVGRRTRPMVCFVNVESVDRIIYSIFQRFNLERKSDTLNLFTRAA